jgi:c(7)-type cytochrome triheme protein
MRHLFAVLSIAAGLLLAWTAFAQDNGKPPAKLTFASKMGNVTFDHAKHVQRAGGKCDTCHTKLFPQSNAPLNFKANMHKTAEASKTSCAACHVEGGSAFAVKGNCAKCHVKG